CSRRVATKMAGINATLVKTLREKTGAGVIACRNALAATAGDFDAAVERLREAELLNADKKANRVAVQGLVGVAVRGATGAIVEVNTETDFVARNDAFRDAVSSFARIALAVGKEPVPFPPPLATETSEPRWTRRSASVAEAGRRAANSDLSELLNAPASDG